MNNANNKSDMLIFIKIIKRITILTNKFLKHKLFNWKYIKLYFT